MPIIVAHIGFVKNNFLIMDFFSQNKCYIRLKVGCFHFFQCDIKLFHQMVIFYNPIYSSLPGVPIILDYPLDTAGNVTGLSS